MTSRFGASTVVDVRDERAALDFIAGRMTGRHAAETSAFPVEEIKALFLDQRVIDCDAVSWLTVTRHRSPIHENAAGGLRDPQPIPAGAHTSRPYHAVRTVNRRLATGVCRSGPATGRSGTAARRRRERTGDPRPPGDPARAQRCLHGARDLGYQRARTKHRADRSVSLRASLIGGALDIRPILHCHRGETGPLDAVRGFEPAAAKLVAFAVKHVRAGLLTPTLCLSDGGEPGQMRAALRGQRQAR